jgi:GAF domain-containing protein
MSANTGPGQRPAFLQRSDTVDEEGRPRALHRLGIASEAVAVFDRVTRDAALALQVPIALLAMSDEQREWSLAQVGVTGHPELVARICAPVIGASTRVLRDAAADPAYASDPLVIGPPYLRAYLAAALYDRQGEPTGALCVVDRQPRPFPPSEIALLGRYAAIVQNIILTGQLSSVGGALPEQHEVYRILLLVP